MIQEIIKVAHYSHTLLASKKKNMAKRFSIQLDGWDLKSEISLMHLKELQSEVFLEGRIIVEPIGPFSCDESRKQLLQAVLKNTTEEDEGVEEGSASLAAAEQMSTGAAEEATLSR